jgi:hypothetical protein
MYPNPPNYAPASGEHLNLNDAVEVELWARALKVDPDDLRLAALIAGPDYDDLIAYFADKSY